MERQSLAGRLTHRIPLLIGWLMLAWHQRSASRNAPIIPHTLVLRVLGDVLCILSLVGAIWARRTLAANWSGNVTFKQNHELIERGPNRFVRHPIYTSMLLMVLGTAFALNRLLSCHLIQSK